MSLVVSLTLVNHLVLIRLLINYFFVFEVDIKQNELLVFIDEILGFVSRDIHAKSIVQFILKGVRVGISGCTNSTTCFDLGHITGCILLGCCLGALAVFDEEAVDVKFLIEKCEHRGADSLAIHCFAFTLLDELKGHLLTFSHSFPVVREFLTQFHLLIGAVHFELRI